MHRFLVSRVILPFFSLLLAYGLNMAQDAKSPTPDGRDLFFSYLSEDFRKGHNQAAEVTNSQVCQMLYFQEWIVAHGCLGIFFLLMLGVFGLPIPDEPLLIFSGYLIFQGRLHLVGVLLASFFGSVVGISVSYFVGRVLGKRFVCHYGHFVGLNPERIHRIHDWFRGIGHWVLVLGYFVPGVRHITAIVAGVSKWELGPFMLFAYFGAFVWVSTFLCIGYFFAEQWGQVAETIHQNLILASCAIAAILTLYLASRFLSSRRAS